MGSFASVPKDAGDVLGCLPPGESHQLKTKEISTRSIGALSTAPVPNPGKGFRPVHKLPLIRLFYASGILFPERIQTDLLQLFTFVQQAQPIAATP